MRTGLVFLVASTVLLAGCLGPPSALDARADDDPPAPRAEADVNEWRPCQHPWPCGDGSRGSGEAGFGLRDGGVETVDLTMSDGVVIGGWIARPDVPEDVKVPIVLQFSIYVATSGPPSPELWPEMFADDDVGLLAKELVAAGFAVAVFNIRGTGVSGGCMDWYHPVEVSDGLAILDHLTDLPWSSGRIGMIGLSYDGAIGLRMATHAPGSLKAIIPVGVAPATLYLLQHTPQGAKDRFHTPTWLSDPGVANGGPETVARSAAKNPRVCPESEAWRTMALESSLSDVRDAPFFDARDWKKDLDAVTAAVLLPSGFLDYGPTGGDWGIALDVDTMWDALPNAPKSLFNGPWGHTDPAQGYPNIPIGPYQDPAEVREWHDKVLGWFTFWLKGVGEPPDVGVARFSPDHVTWYESDAWPPSQATSEVLYLGDDGLSGTPAPGAATYVSAPLVGPAAYGLNRGFDGSAEDGGHGPAALVCNPAPDPRGLVYRSAPLTAPALVAGVPLASLTIASDKAGGVVSVYLYDVDPTVPCAPTFLTAGAANLRLFRGGYAPANYPVNDARHVRIDLDDVVAEIPAGHQVVAVVSAGDASDFVPHKESGAVTVSGDGSPASSHLVLPFFAGSLGGADLVFDYPVRPFSRDWYRAEGASS